MRKLFLSVIILLFGAGVFAVDAKNPLEKDPAKDVVEVLKVKADQPLSTDMAAAQACKKIIAGEFKAAKVFLATVSDANDARIKKLRDILGTYDGIQAGREKSRKEYYDEQIAELDKLAKAADANGLEDVNDITKVLSAALKAKDYALEADKNKILEKPIVKKSIEKSIEKAVEFEEKGEWLEALLNCYSFITLIDEDNKKWEEHREKLTEKALIKASLTDSPCEQSKERHKDIDKEMFKRAITALDYNYVTTIDYSELARKALKRCQLLVSVLTKMELDESISFQRDIDGISAWNSGLNTELEKIDESLIGVTRDKFLNIFNKVLALNGKTIKLTEEVLIAQFAEAALGELDPYTMLVWPWYVEDFKKSMQSEFSGVGIEISKRDGPLTVSSLLADTPAYNSGIDAGDIIEAVDGESTKDMTLECAVRKITGPEGTPVVLTVRNPKEDDSRDIKIVRAKIKVPTIRSWRRNEQGKWLNMIDDVDKIGYIRITSFTSEKTSDELEKQLDELEKAGMQGLVLDLRFNSGGYLTQAIEVVDKFVSSGLIVSTRPRLGSFPTWEIAKKSNVHPDYPLVVLINGQSASASEIVAGALQDETHKRALLVGSRTYGKGSVQTIIGYPGGGAQLKYTMAHYHLPSGHRVKNRYEREKLDKEDWGVAPDIEVDLKGNEIKKLYEVQRDNAVLFSKEHNGDPNDVQKHSVRETIDSDPQLGIAVLILKTQLVQQEISASDIIAKNRNVSQEK